MCKKLQIHNFHIFRATDFWVTGPEPYALESALNLIVLKLNNLITVRAIKMQIGDKITSYVGVELGKYRWLSVSTCRDIEFQPASDEWQSKFSATDDLLEFIARVLFHLRSCKLKFCLIITSSIDNNFLYHCSCHIFRVIEFQLRVSDRVIRYSANGWLLEFQIFFNWKLQVLLSWKSVSMPSVVDRTRVNFTAVAAVIFP